MDYDGAIGASVTDDGWLSVNKMESYVGIGDEKEVYWGPEWNVDPVDICYVRTVMECRV